MNNNNTGAWVIGVILVLILGFGLYWLMNRTPATVETSTQTTTTTTATTTQTKTNPVAKEIRTSATVSEVIASLGDASTFSSYFVSTGVSASVTGAGPYTVFVPSNTAFGKLAPGTVSGLTATQKKRLVQYHVVSGKKLDIDAIETSTIQALSKDMLNFEALGPQYGGKVNNSVVVRQYNAKNGVVYIVDAVLLPPQAPLN